MSAPLDLFYSYSKADERYLNALKKHLSRLVQMGLIRDWSDQNITPASEWEEAIETRIRTAQIILFLVSADFIASEYCMKIELPCVLDRYERNERVAILPIILRHCPWKDIDLQRFQVLPTRARPVQEWRSKDLAYQSIYDGVKQAALNLGATITLPPHVRGTTNLAG